MKDNWIKVSIPKSREEERGLACIGRKFRWGGEDGGRWGGE